ncbi:hypothetical protein A8W25_30410 [Streptomyces sp. ERV7]|uniref:hypothetical protein n=1 Tax=Streptomyces sp. ERV7 TaxID=1322334 RepID=UPI0007F4018A|nr:hypothetical protein [Streptomyces sp. ERV7]OAR21983.1 hypothetical protein A8W25_30410 [Streptomyces sp. ERV7]
MRRRVPGGGGSLAAHGNSGQEQTYGTQYTTVEGTFGPYPVADPDDLDERRARAGLQPQAEYDARMRQTYG